MFPWGWELLSDGGVSPTWGPRRPCSGPFPIAVGEPTLGHGPLTTTRGGGRIVLPQVGQWDYGLDPAVPAAYNPDHMDHVLVVDDEPAIVAVVRGRLEREGFSVRASSSGEDALDQMASDPPDMVVLDVGLPGIDGFEVLRRMREASNRVPVVMLTARDEDVDRIVGLEMGADDYVVKPFNPRELSARIRAILRRQAEIKQARARLAKVSVSADGCEERLCFDHSRRRASFDGHSLDLRPREYDLLRFLARHRGQVFSRDALLTHVWGHDAFIGARTVDVHVRRVRKKLAAIAPTAEVILTEWGVGYRLAEDV